MITILGRTTFRNERRPFGIRQADRRAHVYVIGQTGTGKSTLLEAMIRQDLAAGEGLALLDPHGDLVERLLRDVPETRRSDLIYVDVPDMSQPWGFNALRSVPPDKRPLAASALLDAFKKLWSDSWGPRLEHILRNSLFALLDQPEATLADVLRLLSDDDYRRAAMGCVASAAVRRFWLREFKDYPARFRAEAIAPVQNKVGAFLANPLLQRILTQPNQLLDLRQIMDEGKVLLVNLAKGKIGEDTAALLGSLLVASLGTAVLARADQRVNERRDFWIYLDEFHTVTTLSLATMLSELRKYRVGFTLAHQYVAQLDEAVQAAVFGNVATICCFRIGAPDAEVLAPQFAPLLRVSDLVTLPNRHMYVRLLVDGKPSEPFSAETLPPPAPSAPRDTSSLFSASQE
jgi:energy-coupling factor transporter ATP-binding protein EcfA2